MIEITGKHNTALCFTDLLEPGAFAQIQAVCDEDAFAESKIRIMPDGSLICIGKGNEDWNCSAPHGAGRLMSRSAAFQRLTMEEYRAEMAEVYSTCVVPNTLDESPMAYKSMDEIVRQITPTAEIVCRITPIYNFKAAE